MTAQSADRAYAELEHQHLFLYFDTSPRLAAFWLVDPYFRIRSPPSNASPAVP